MSCQVAEQRSPVVDDALSECAKFHLRKPDRTEDDDDLTILSSLIALSARPSASDLEKLSQFHPSGDWFKSCCLRAVTSAANPFIPGITLSIRLGQAAKQASEGERRAITDVKSSVDELVLEIFERLPQTVRGFEDEGGVDVSTGVFEPIVSAKNESVGLRGPMEMITSQQQQLETFCRVPLLMDFLLNKFTMGLPDLIDTAGVLSNPECLHSLEDCGLALHDGVGRSLQGNGEDVPNEVFPSLTFFPGAQFILVGVIAAPNIYYRVPAMRMALDFVVYVGMVAALSFCVLFHATTESVTHHDGIVETSFSEGACALIFVTVSTSQTFRAQHAVLMLVDVLSLQKYGTRALLAPQAVDGNFRHRYVYVAVGDQLCCGRLICLPVL